MSPEQLAAEEVDPRTDVWSFGCVLFEAASGASPFREQTVVATLGAVAGREPRWNLLPRSVPAPLVELLRRCLTKSPQTRLQQIDGARAFLEQAKAMGNPGSPVDLRGRPTRWPASAARVAAGGSVLLAGLALAFYAGRGSAPSIDLPVTGFTVVLPEDAPIVDGELNRFALSPGGTLLVYVGTAGPDQRLYRRRLDEAQGHEVPGTIGAEGPFFSPDGEWIGFFSDGALWKVPASGGDPVRLTAAGAPRGATWGARGSIVFAPEVRSGLFTISEDGGISEPLTRLDPEAGEVTHRWPAFAPGGRSLAYVVGTDRMSSFDGAELVIMSMDSREVRRVSGGSGPRFAGADHLVFARGKQLFGLAVPSTSQLGIPVPVLDDVGVYQSSGRALFDLSESGTLAYVPYSSATRTALSRVDLGGAFTDVTDADQAYRSPRLSPDQRSVAVGTINVDGTADIWTLELARGSATRLTFEGLNGRPVWSPDGRRIAFASSRGGGPGTYNLFVVPSDGRAPATRMRPSAMPERPADWLPDGTLLLERLTDTTGNDILRWDPEGAGDPEPLLATPFNESTPRVSPDGRSIAYVSDESGQLEVYVRGFARQGPRVQISVDGGTEPIWSRDGDRLYYRQGTEMNVVDVGLEDGMGVSSPETLFSGGFEAGFGSWGYDLLQADEAFLMIRSARTAHLRLAVNWANDLPLRLADSEDRRPPP